MKTFKDIISEVAEPRPRREKAFKDKHVVQKINHPVADESQFTAKKIKKDKTKPASMHDGEDSSVYEEVEQLDELSPNKLHAYIKGASKDLAKRSRMSGYDDKRGNYADGDKNRKRANKRMAGVASASGRLADKANMAEMTDAEKKKREDIVMGMKKSKADLKKRYSDRWKSVMYATATKNAMKEDVEQLDEIGDTTAGKKKLKNLIVNRTQKVVDAGASIERRPEKAAEYDKAQRRHMKTIGRAAERLAKESVDLDENVYASDYNAGHEKSQFGGYRPHVTHKKTGKTMYLGQTSYKKPEHAKGHAAAYLKGYQQMGDKTANRMGSEYQKANKKHVVREEVEQIDELKKSTLGSYIKKASARAVSDKTNADGLSRRAFDAKDRDDAEKYFDASDRMQKKYKNRLAGIAKATDKITKEEVEYMDEAFKAGSMKLKDGSSVKVTSEQASALNALFNELNTSNKKKMEERLMSNSKGFSEILSFAKEAF